MVNKEAQKRWNKTKSNPVEYSKRKEYMKKWFRDYKRDYRKHADVVYFNGNREEALARDGFRCVFCGISNDEHQHKYGVAINVHHIDNRGFAVKKSDRNGELKNLLTVCVSCHAKIHHGVV